jgi:hypothetical protein
VGGAVGDADDSNRDEGSIIDVADSRKLQLELTARGLERQASHLFELAKKLKDAGYLDVAEQTELQACELEKAIAQLRALELEPPQEVT